MEDEAPSVAVLLITSALALLIAWVLLSWGSSAHLWRRKDNLPPRPLATPLLGNLLQAEEDYLASVELGHVPAAAKLRALRSVSPGPRSLRCSPRNLCAAHQMPGAQTER